MPTASLNFNLPEENYDFKLASNAAAFMLACDDIRNYARQLRKYEERKEIPTEEVSEKLYELLSELPEL